MYLFGFIVKGKKVRLVSYSFYSDGQIITCIMPLYYCDKPIVKKRLVER